jgi:hypothetical protein
VLESSAGGGIGIVAAVSEAESNSVPWSWSTLGGGLESISFTFVSTYRKRIIAFYIMRRIINTSYKCLLYTLLYFLKKESYHS